MYSSATPRDVLPPNDNDNEVSPSTVVESFSYDSTTNALDRYYHADMERILNTKRTMWEQQLHDTRRSQDDDDNDDDDDKYAPFAPWFARHKSSPRRAPGDGRNSHIHNEDRPPLLDDHTLNVLAWIRQLNRKQRPPIVTHDFDGAQRVHEMLLEWQQRQLPNEWHAPQQQQQQQWSSGMKSYEIVMQAYLQRGRLRWLGTDPHDDVYPTTPSLDETIQVLFDPEFLVEDDKTREETTMNLRKVICAADVLQDLYHQWQWNHPSQSRQYIRNRETTGVIADSEPGSNATTSSSSSTSGVPEPSMPNNAVPLLWNPVSACWLAGQAVCATPRGGMERNYAERALDFVHALRNQTLATTNKMPVEALLHGIHAAAWHQGISHPTTDSTPSIPTSATTSSAEEEEEQTVHHLQPEEEGGVFSKKETNDMYHWAREAHAMRNELITLLQPNTIANETITSRMPVQAIPFWAYRPLGQEHDETTTISSANRHMASCQNTLEVCLLASALTIQAWSKSGSPGSGPSAHAILDRMRVWNTTLTRLQTSTESKDGAAMTKGGSRFLDTEVYLDVILAWCKDGNPTQAQHVLDDMIDLYHQGAFVNWPADLTKTEEKPVLPTIAFNSVISAWGKQGDMTKAIQVLQKMQKLSQTSIPDQPLAAAPNVLSYNLILSSLLHQSTKDGKKKKQYRNKERQQDELATNTKCALSLVGYMEDQYDLQPAIRPNALTYWTLIRILLETVTQTANARPRKMRQEEYTDTKDSSFMTNRSWLFMKHVQSALKQLMVSWEEGDRSVDPSNRIFNMVINTFAKKGGKDTDVVFELLEQMKQSKMLGIQPDIITLTSVLEYLSKHPSSPPSSSSTLALDMLQEAVTNYKETLRPELRPNVRFFSMVILTLSQTGGSVHDARSVLTDLLDLYEETGHSDLVPNSYPYNYVLNCAANTLATTWEERQQAFCVAAQTYKDIRNSPYNQTVQSDSFTYGFWMKCCNNLLDQGNPQQAELREKCLRFAFDECKERGLVTKEILTRLYQGCSTDTVREILQESLETESTGFSSRHLGRQEAFSNTVLPPDISHLPPSWSRNTRKPYSQRKRLRPRQTRTRHNSNNKRWTQHS